MLKEGPNGVRMHFASVGGKINNPLNLLFFQNTKDSEPTSAFSSEPTSITESTSAFNRTLFQANNTIRDSETVQARACST